MKTRFDYSGVWITGVGEAVPVGNMETPHLLNTVRMLVQKPARTLSILVADIEHATFSDTVWTPFNADDRKQSLKNVTSLSDAELVEYVQSTPLFKSMIEELQERGVNTKNVLSDKEVRRDPPQYRPRNVFGREPEEGRSLPLCAKPRL